MQTATNDSEALSSAYREIDRLRAGVVDLKAIIRSLEAQKTMALDHGTVPQNSTQVIDFIGVRHEDHVLYSHSDTGMSPFAAQNKD